MTAGRVLDLAILVVLLLVLTRLIPAAWAMFRLWVGVRRRRLQDGSAIAPPPSPVVAAVAARLGVLGFARIGERTLVLPGVGRKFEWNLADAATTTYASIVPTIPQLGGAMVTLYSAFGDGAFVQTSWPRGTPVRRSDLLSTPVTTTLEDAISVHARAIDEFRAVHGAPLPNRSMRDLLVRDATYRSRHGGATFRGRTWTVVAYTSVTVFAAAAVLVRLVVLDR